MTRQQSLKNLIEISGLNQTEFAKKHGVTQQRVSEWIRAVRNISNGKLEEIANKEGYSLSINFKLDKL